jgi:hypothetical protein
VIPKEPGTDGPRGTAASVHVYRARETLGYDAAKASWMSSALVERARMAQNPLPNNNQYLIWLE